ncbi:porin [Polycladidibacter stylochi]|uniref:porin n=1 Tax=Polycladidibacter stylochi TaxID=1807766 RepID=UPI0008332E60|nr:porin [Pseudovibrio stylochi]
MNAKLIAMAAAAAAAATSAQAADLPTAAEPIDYVQACDAFGAGFFKLPGKDTCIKLGGRIRVNVESEDLQDSSDDVSDYEYYTKGYLYFTSMTDTEIGLIKTYTEFTAKFDSEGGEKVEAGDTYIQFSLGSADLSFGKMGDVFAGFTGYAEMGVAKRHWADDGSLQVRLAAPLGNGLTATAALIDSNSHDGADGKVDFNGALELKQGWGKVKVSGAAHQNAYDETGYAVNGNAEFKLDPITIGFGGQYAKDAHKYAGVGFKNDYVLGVIEGEDITVDFNNIESTVYSVGGGIKFAATDEITLAVDGSYMSFEGTADFDYKVGENDALSIKDVDVDVDAFGLDGSIAYAPVDGLVLAVDAGWDRTEMTATKTVEDEGGNKKVKVSSDDDNFKVGARVQYTF